MLTIFTIPKPDAGLNVSKLVVQVSSPQQYGLTFTLTGFGKFTKPDGSEVWSTNPIMSDTLAISGESLSNWPSGGGEVENTYVGDLALAQLGLERDPDGVDVPAENAPPAEESE